MENEPTSYQGYRTLVLIAHKNHPQWRLGQAYFNVLHRVREDLSGMVRASIADPFHQDNRIPTFLKFIKENW